MNPENYLYLAALLFTIGAAGVLLRRNAIVVFMCVELMLNAANLAFVTFARMNQSFDGQVIAFFTMVVAAIFSGLAIWFFQGGDDRVMAWLAMACLVLGSVVSYARARAEGLGMTASVGIAERADRLVAALVTTGLVGLGLPEVVLKVVLAVLAVASVITILQRVLFVRQQVLAEEAADSTPATS